MPNYDIVLPQAPGRLALPTRSGEGNNTPQRFSPYGDTQTMPLALMRHHYALEGTYFIAHNTTNDAATTIAGHAAPVLVDADVTLTKPFVHCVYNASAGSLLRCQLDYLQIEVITAGANGTADSWAAELDTGTSRITTPGTALTTLNPNMQSATTPLLAPTAGPIVVSAETSAVRNLGHGQFRPSIQIAGDKYTFVFGGDPAACESVATITHHVVPLPPVILGSTDAFMLALYSPSQSAAGVYKVRMAWVER